jgi:hypothetical protein
LLKERAFEGIKMNEGRYQTSMRSRGQKQEAVGDVVIELALSDLHVTSVSSNVL